jgi:hypothetical protein
VGASFCSLGRQNLFGSPRLTQFSGENVRQSKTATASLSSLVNASQIRIKIRVRSPFLKCVKSQKIFAVVNLVKR